MLVGNCVRAIPCILIISLNNWVLLLSKVRKQISRKRFHIMVMLVRPGYVYKLHPHLQDHRLKIDVRLNPTMWRQFRTWRKLKRSNRRNIIFFCHIYMAQKGPKKVASLVGGCQTSMRIVCQMLCRIKLLQCLLRFPNNGQERNLSCFIFQDF